jgi:hypothetical protein
MVLGGEGMGRYDYRLIRVLRILLTFYRAFRRLLPPGDPLPEISVAFSRFLIFGASYYMC